jgi:hypothetical protein
MTRRRDRWLQAAPADERAACTVPEAPARESEIIASAARAQQGGWPIGQAAFSR